MQAKKSDRRDHFYKYSNCPDHIDTVYVPGTGHLMRTTGGNDISAEFNRDQEQVSNGISGFIYQR